MNLVTLATKTANGLNCTYQIGKIETFVTKMCFSSHFNQIQTTLLFKITFVSVKYYSFGNSLFGNSLREVVS